MTTELEVKNEVRRFYDRVGWQTIGAGLYQNARYEDLRPVSAEYRHRCHLRVGRYLPGAGTYLLDAGSGPIQYPEYLAYSAGFDYRVCLDLSLRALIEARQRLAVRGLYVVGDVACLPFREAVFGGVVSLHTIHHLPPGEHERAFRGLYRALSPGGRAVVVYSWGDRSGLMRLAAPLIGLAGRMRGLRRRPKADSDGFASSPSAELLGKPGTYSFRHDHRWFYQTLVDLPGFEIRVWRSVSVQFLRSLVHPKLLGRPLLAVLGWLEERLPRWLGRHGQYPMILFAKPARLAGESRTS